MIIPGAVAVNNGFIFNPSGAAIGQANIGESSVNLTVGHMLSTKDGEITSSTSEIVIKPQQTSLIISQECFNIPKKVMAQALLKNRMSQEGLIAFNTGIVDAEYRKPISTMVTNLSRNDIVINYGQPFLRIIFHRLDEENLTHLIPKPLNKSEVEGIVKEYIGYRKIDIAKLPPDFFAIGSIKDKIMGELREYSLAKFFTLLGATVSIFVIIMTLLNTLIIPPLQENSFEKALANSQQEMLLLELRLRELESSISNQEARDQSLEESSQSTTE